MEKNAKIYVAGHRGMVGSAIIRALKRRGFEILYVCSKDGMEREILEKEGVPYKETPPIEL